MNNRTLTKPKNKNLTTFSQVFGKNLSGRTFTPEPANEGRDVLNSQFGHNFGDVQVENPSFKDSCPLSLSSPSHCPFGGACHTCPLRIQTKLKIGQPNDKYEQEADRVAEQVMSLPKPKVQRQECLTCNDIDEEEQMQTKPIAERITPLVQRQVEEEEEILQTKEAPGQTPGVTRDVQMNINNLSGTGKPLPESERFFFEQRFGYDFSKIRVHTDTKATDSARAMNAKAYTAGQHLVFQAREYVPETVSGKKLIAHELAHVIQQRCGVKRNGSVDTAGDSYEEHADVVADLVVQRRPAKAHLDWYDAHADSVTDEVVQRKPANDWWKTSKWYRERQAWRYEVCMAGKGEKGEALAGDHEACLEQVKKWTGKPLPEVELPPDTIPGPKPKKKKITIPELVKKALKCTDSVLSGEVKKRVKCFLKKRPLDDWFIPGPVTLDPAYNGDFKKWVHGAYPKFSAKDFSLELFIRPRGKLSWRLKGIAKMPNHYNNPKTLCLNMKDIDHEIRSAMIEVNKAATSGKATSKRAIQIKNWIYRKQKDKNSIYSCYT